MGGYKRGVTPRVLSDNRAFYTCLQRFNIRLYEVAEVLGIHEGTLCRRLRWLVAGQELHDLKGALRYLVSLKGMDSSLVDEVYGEVEDTLTPLEGD